MDFLGACAEFRYDHVKIAINKNNDIVMSKQGAREVFVCDNRGNLKHKFEIDLNWWTILSISNKNEILVPSINHQAVHISYENTMWTINLPEGHWIREVSFHFAFSKIIVLTYVKKKDSYFLLSYTEEGELETCTTNFYNMHETPGTTSHPSGSFAVVTQNSITFI